MPGDSEATSGLQAQLERLHRGQDEVGAAVLEVLREVSTLPARLSALLQQRAPDCTGPSQAEQQAGGGAGATLHGPFNGAYRQKGAPDGAAQVIRGDTIVWGDGSQATIVHEGARALFTRQRNAPRHATLQSEGVLVWDDGEVWLRDRAEDLQVSVHANHMHMDSATSSTSIVVTPGRLSAGLSRGLSAQESTGPWLQLANSSLGLEASTGPGPHPRRELMDHAQRGFSPLRRWKPWKSAATSFRWDRQVLLPLHPVGSARLAFDCLSVPFLLYDSTAIPVLLAWDLQLEGWLLAVGWVAILFWVTDVVLNFVTAFEREREVVVAFKEIYSRYLRTTFVPDACVVVFDFAWLLGSTVQSGVAEEDIMFSRVAIIAKVGRILRVGRLVGVVSKLRWAMGVDKVLSTAAKSVGMEDHFEIMVKGIYLGFLILWLNHLGSCLYHIIGFVVPSDTGQSVDEGSLGADVLSMYQAGFYWSLNTMFSGGTCLYPSNTCAWVFSQLHIIASSLFVSLVTSYLAAMLIEAQVVKQKHTEQLRTLSQFLEQRSVRPRLAMAIRREAAIALEKGVWLSDRDVPLLSQLSAHLRAELRHNLYASHFLGHGLFRICHMIDRRIVRALCSVLDPMTIGFGDELLTAAEQEMDCAYILREGSMLYLPRASAESNEDLSMHRSVSSGTVSEDGSASQVAVTSGQWVFEIALWARWRPQGNLEAATACELLKLTFEGFFRALADHLEVIGLVRHYSLALCETLQKEGHTFHLDLGIKVDCDCILVVAPAHIREMLSARPLKTLRKVTGGLSLGSLFQKARKSLEDLRLEVQRGECLLVQDASGKILRVVHVVVLHIQRWDGLVCVRLAKWQNGRGVPALALPGAKVQGEDYPDKAVQQIVEAEFSEMGGALAFGSRQVVVEQRGSESYGLETKYIRRVYKGFVAPHDGSIAGARGQHDEGLNEVGSGQAVHEPLDDGYELFPKPTGKKHSFERRTQRDRQDPITWEAFAVPMRPTDGVATIYAWLRAQDFTMLQADQQRADEVITEWLASFGTWTVHSCPLGFTLSPATSN